MNKNKNVCFVKARKQHICNECNKSISIGDLCFTVSKKYKGRLYYCESCVNELSEIKRMEVIMKNTSDDGTYLACQDYIRELAERLE